jgi:hypothetical protein
MNTCPVCGYDKLEFPPINFTICACCGTEFGYDDRVLTADDLRMRWIRHGCPWFDAGEQIPERWNPFVQMFNAKLNYPPFVEEFRVQANITVETDMNFDPESRRLVFA